jgi:hypothetical protein
VAAFTTGCPERSLSQLVESHPGPLFGALERRRETAPRGLENIAPDGALDGHPVDSVGLDAIRERLGAIDGRELVSPVVDTLVDDCPDAARVGGRGRIDTDHDEAGAHRVRARGFDRERVERRTIADGLGAFETYTDWPVIRDTLEAQFSPAEVDGILGENFLKFWERVAESREKTN